MALEGALLDILACPIDKRGLLYFADEAILYNPRLRRVYRLANGCPVMLADRAEPADQEEHVRLMKRAGCGEATGTAGLDAARAARDAVRAADEVILGATGNARPDAAGPFGIGVPAV